MEETTTETTVEESQQATTDIMSEVYDKLIGNDSDEVVSDEKEEDGVEAAGKDADDEGNETDKDVEHKTEAKTEEIDKEEAKTKVGSLKPLKNWPKEDREIFEGLPEDAQKSLMGIHKNMHVDYTRKTQAIAEVTRALEPLKDIIRNRDVTQGQAVNQIIGMFLDIHNNPVKGIQHIAKTYGLDLEGISTYWDNPDEFAETEGIKGNRIEKKSPPQMSESDIEAYSSKLEEFKEWREGKEFIEQVEGKMADLAAIETQSGIPNSSFDDLYEDACWLVPEVKEVLLERKLAGNLEESAKDKKKRAVKAEKAAKTLKSTSHEPENKREKEPKNTSEAMLKAWDEQESRPA